MKATVVRMYEWMWMCFNKTLFTRTSNKLVLACQQGYSLLTSEHKAQVEVWAEIWMEDNQGLDRDMPRKLS